MKEQQAKLLSSLTAMTTHFAHVQFRLRQVIDAPLQEKELLLRDLEQFTFKGIPDFPSSSSQQTHTDVNRIKNQLILQLKTQISELESSIKYLQKDSTEKQNKGKYDVQNTIVKSKDYKNNYSERKAPPSQTTKMSTYVSFIRKLLTILHIVNAHCNEEKDNIQRDIMKNTQKFNHWGDIRARLEMAVLEVTELAEEPNVPVDSDYMSDSEGSSYYNQKLATVVRKKLAPAIQHLMQHGLMHENRTISVTSGLTTLIGCVPTSASSFISNNEDGHAWDLILKYYSMKNGDQFNSAPALKLSQSFNLDIAGSFRNTSVQYLLVTIGNIVSTHTQFKRGYNAQFKAFVCAGLNAKLLANWLLMIFRCKQLIEMYYEPWSYSLKIGFEDCCKSLEKLNHFSFNLPVNVAVHDLQNIKDAF